MSKRERFEGVNARNQRHLKELRSKTFPYAVNSQKLEVGVVKAQPGQVGFSPEKIAERLDGVLALDEKPAVVVEDRHEGLEPTVDIPLQPSVEVTRDYTLLDEYKSGCIEATRDLKRLVDQYETFLYRWLAVFDQAGPLVELMSSSIKASDTGKWVTEDTAIDAFARYQLWSKNALYLSDKSRGITDETDIPGLRDKDMRYVANKIATGTHLHYHSTWLRGMSKRNLATTMNIGMLRSGVIEPNNDVADKKIDVIINPPQSQRKRGFFRKLLGI